MIMLHQSKRSILKQFKDTVQLYCYCQTPWVDGSTSAAIYGNAQRDYNMHNCSKCDNWFHKYCLIACSIAIPKQNADFVCNARITSMEFTNTCTSDNFLIILQTIQTLSVTVKLKTLSKQQLY